MSGPDLCQMLPSTEDLRLDFHRSPSMLGLSDGEEFGDCRVYKKCCRVSCSLQNTGTLGMDITVVGMTRKTEACPCRSRPLLPCSDAGTQGTGHCPRNMIHHEASSCCSIILSWLGATHCGICSQGVVSSPDSCSLLVSTQPCRFPEAMQVAHGQA